MKEMSSLTPGCLPKVKKNDGDELSILGRRPRLTLSSCHIAKPGHEIIRFIIKGSKRSKRLSVRAGTTRVNELERQAREKTETQSF